MSIRHDWDRYFNGQTHELYRGECDEGGFNGSAAAFKTVLVRRAWRRGLVLEAELIGREDAPVGVRFRAVDPDYQISDLEK